MMTRGNPPPLHSTNDEAVARLARNYRHESIATLVTVARDPEAPASARAMAARTLLEYADGRPTQARQPTIADVAAMSDEQRMQLLEALVYHYTPSGLTSLVQQSVGQLEERMSAQPRPNRFTRGEPAPLPLHIPQPSNRRSVPARLNNEAAAMRVTRARYAHEARAQASAVDEMNHRSLVALTPSFSTTSNPSTSLPMAS
jgi:hypothetical protein